MGGVSADMVKQSNQFFLLLWFANLTTVGLLMGVGFILASQNPDADPLALAPDVFEHILVYVLYGVAISLFIAALKLPRIFAKKVAASDLEKPGPLDPGIKIRLMAPYIIRIALMESCAITGFVLAVVSESYLVGLPIMAFSVVALLLSRPTDELLRSFRSN